MKNQTLTLFQSFKVHINESHSMSHSHVCIYSSLCKLVTYMNTLTTLNLSSLSNVISNKLLEIEPFPLILIGLGFVIFTFS